MFAPSSSSSNVGDPIRVVSNAIACYEDQKNSINFLKVEVNTLERAVRGKLKAPHVTEASRKCAQEFLASLKDSRGLCKTTDAMVDSSLKRAKEQLLKLNDIDKQLNEKSPKQAKEILRKNAYDIQEEVLTEQHGMTLMSARNSVLGSAANLAIVQARLTNIRANLGRLDLNLLD